MLVFPCHSWVLPSIPKLRRRPFRFFSTFLSPVLCNVEERASCGQQALHRAGPCMGRDSGSSHPANTSLRGLVSEPGPSPGGEAGKEGWLKVNIQDEAEERITERGKID